uniref:Uncharacterized protein n=1 Tax=Rhizophagus irregularis (strain DAOM 181602 / DAOM 197198 / MUCL 43194) TaxID=747089 RepID=U9SUM9_RHIID
MGIYGMINKRVLMIKYISYEYQTKFGLFYYRSTLIKLITYPSFTSLIINFCFKEYLDSK